jgi:hypothetical protein
MSKSNQELLDSDYQYKEAHGGQPLRANYWWFIGDIPEVRARDFNTCRQIVEKLEQARIECAPLTSSEHSRLTQLIKKWSHRAAGEDQRFNVRGTKRGALTNAEKERLQKLGWVPTKYTKPTKPKPRVKCQGCSRLFIQTRSDRKFCSTYCKSSYWSRQYSGA